MMHGAVFPAARPLRAAFIFGTALLAAAFAYSGNARAQSGETPGANMPAARSAAAPTKPAPAPSAKEITKPLWSELTPAQQQALAPLAGEWDQLDTFRKNKWLAIGNKYATMNPAEQQRVQERMRDWVKLTPEQRRIARESYARAKKLNPDQKSAQWQQYQQLPEEQKRKLAADAASKKRVATLPSAVAQGTPSKTVPPIKSAPKRVIEHSVTPQAASQSALQTPPPSQTK